jgi:hypothetical protein
MGVADMPDSGNDQGQLAIHYCENTDKYRLDTKGTIWTALHYAESAISTRPEGIFNNLSKVYPSVIHGNGRTNLHHVVDHLGL